MARSGTDKLTRLLCPPTLVPAPAGPHASAAHNASKPVSAPCMTLARLLRVSGDDVGDHHRHAFGHRNGQELVRTLARTRDVEGKSVALLFAHGGDCTSQ